MSSDTFEIRLCDSCGLRYPLQQGHPHGTRCPICMGNTRVVLNRQLVYEPEPIRPMTNTVKTKRTSTRKKQAEKTSKRIGDLGGMRGEQKWTVLLDNVRSAWNVGSILRSADGFGFDHAYVCGISPTPDNEAVTKTSLGAEDSVTWSYHKDAVKLVKGLKKEGYTVFALEEEKRAMDISDARAAFQAEERAILIVGNEVTGVDPELLDLCAAIYYIPMRGEKKSFNVAIAFSVAAYALR